MNIEELFDGCGVTAQDFIKAIRADVGRADMRITASELCAKTGDGSVSQKRIEDMRAIMEELERQKKIRIMGIFHGKSDGFPKLKDYLFVANKPFREADV